jgi:putative iron-only hydrogenase system regulator
MAKVAVISAILEHPELCQHAFNEVVASFKGIVKGRMGIPLEEHGISVISITLIGEPDEINALTGRLGNIEHVSVKTSISKKEV